VPFFGWMLQLMRSRADFSFPSCAISPQTEADPQHRSGRQELVENAINDQLFAVGQTRK
jgi:xylose isomerase